MTRRQAQIALLLCGVAWILLSTLIAPGIIQSAYDGRSYEILNRLISGRAEHSVDFYLRKWVIASWMALIVTIVVLLPVLLFTPKQLFKACKKYWFRPAPLGYLGLLRIIAVGAQLIMLLIGGGYGLRHLAGLASLPDSMYKPLPALQLFLLPIWTRCQAIICAGDGDLLDNSSGWHRCAGGMEIPIHSAAFAVGNTFLQSFRLFVRRPSSPGGTDDYYTMASGSQSSWWRIVGRQLFRQPKFFAP